DSISISPDAYGEFSIDTLWQGSTVLSNSTFALPVLFQCDSDRTRLVQIHVHAHSGSHSGLRTIDTIITLRAQHSTVAGPLMSIEWDSVYMETRYCQPI